MKFAFRLQLSSYVNTIKPQNDDMIHASLETTKYYLFLPRRRTYNSTQPSQIFSFCDMALVTHYTLLVPNAQQNHNLYKFSYTFLFLVLFVATSPMDSDSTHVLITLTKKNQVCRMSEFKTCKKQFHAKKKTLCNKVQMI